MCRVSEEARGLAVRKGERKEGQGRGPGIEPSFTLRLKTGTEDQRPTKEARNRTGVTVLKRAMSVMSNAEEKAWQMRTKRRSLDLVTRKVMVFFARRWKQNPDYRG